MPPFFASIETVHELERAECRLLLEVAGVIAERREGVVTMPIAGGVAAYVGEGAPMNKITGLGFGALPTSDELDRAEALFLGHGVRVQAEVSTHADIGLGEMLTKRGYTLAGFESVLVCRPAEHRGTEGVAGLEIGIATDFERWLDTIVDGFIVPDGQGIEAPESFDRASLRAVIADMARCTTMHHYIATKGGVPVGGADMRMGDGVAQLCGASTLPEHRRQGVQTALLQHRINAAADAGCEYMVVSTLPGSKSQQNVQRHGFELAHTKAVLVLEPEGA